jgi:iron complex outermembrane receptor protein
MSLGNHAAIAADSQESATGTLDEVVVTAEKRQESVQSVPVAITVIPAEELERQGVQQISDLARSSSSVEFTASSAAPGGGAFIRGIGTESVGGDTATASVGIVVDGVVQGNTNISDIFDISRVEILKGPQGTLFGSSVSAGVISVTTNAPDPTAYSGSVSAEYGAGDLGSEYQRRSLRAVLNLPLSDNSALRFSFHSDDNSGVFHDPYTGTSSDEPDIGARVRYMIAPTDDFKINVIADYNNYRGDGWVPLEYRSAPAGSPTAEALAQCGITPSPSNFNNCSGDSNFRNQLDRGISLQLDWNVGPATLTSVTSYRLGDTSSRDDIETIPLSIAEGTIGADCHFFNCVPIVAILPGGTNSVQTQSRQLFNQELRLASSTPSQLDWTAGLFFQRSKLYDNEPGLINALFTGFNYSSTNFFASTSAEDIAAFGNLTYHLTDSTRLIAGGRITHSDVDESKNDPANSHTPDTYSIAGSNSVFSWRAGLQQDLATHTMLYFTVSTGFKAPEIADNLAAPPARDGGLYVISPEKPTSYELGLKQSLLDNRLALDADVFFEDVKDYQGQNCVDNGQGTISCVPANVPKVQSKGVEVDMFGRPYEGLTVNLSAIYNPATYPGGYLGSDGTVIGGQQLNYSSREKVTLSAEQRVPLTGEWSGVGGVDYTWRSAQSLYPSAESGYLVPATSIVNLRLGVEESKRWSFFVFTRNLTNSHFPRQLYTVAFQPGAFFQSMDAASLRLVGLQAQAKF